MRRWLSILLVLAATMTSAVSLASGAPADIQKKVRALVSRMTPIDDITLDRAQLDLASALTGTGKPVILVMIEGRPRLINSVVDGVKGVVLGFRPGMEGGRALANILFGDAVPSGKLPVTYPRYPNALVCYDVKPLDIGDVNKYDPQWPFGFGLSYTTFSYSDLKLNRSTLTRPEKLTVSVDVKNTGVEGLSQGSAPAGRAEDSNQDS
jgi:beta-glucosidase